MRARILVVGPHLARAATNEATKGGSWRRCKSTSVAGGGRGPPEAVGGDLGVDDVKPFSSVPGPRAIPILGNMWRFIPGIGDFSNVSSYELFPELFRRYGPIVRLDGLLKQTTLLVADPDAAQQVFRTEGQYPIRSGISSVDYYYQNYRKNLAFGLGTANGELWHKFRTIVNQVVMQPRNVKVYVEPIDAVALEFIARMKTLRDDRLELPDDFATELCRWTAESITHVMLGIRLGMLRADLAADSDGARWLRLVRDTFDTMGQLEFGLSPWQYLPTPAWRKFKRSLDEFTELATKYVKEVVEGLSRLTADELESRQLSVLERLLVNNANDPEKADKGVAFALDMVLAGIDTTANQTESVMYLLASNPEKQRALQAELDRELPSDRGGRGAPLSGAVLERLRYVRAAVKEATRMQSAVSGVFRTVSQDLDLMGYRIPKGTHAVVCSSAMSNDERLVPRAGEYLPERWLPGHEHLKPRHAFVHVPFGFGPRMCAGKRFADMEIEVLIARLLQSYNLEWHHPPPVVQQKFFVSYSSPLKFTLREREEGR